MANKEGWFSTPGRPGDRTLEEQLKGLIPLCRAVEDKSVLDVGCAEGLISILMARHGAKFVRGIEIVPGHVKVAREQAAWLPYSSIAFVEDDANTYLPTCQYDVVLMLAILHKLRDPVAACKRFADAAKELVVIRLPPEGAPVIRDVRTGFKPFDIGAIMLQSGWELTDVTQGHFNEWTGYYRRSNSVPTKSPCDA